MEGMCELRSVWLRLALLVGGCGADCEVVCFFSVVRTEVILKLSGVYGVDVDGVRDGVQLGRKVRMTTVGPAAARCDLGGKRQQVAGRQVVRGSN